jgi:hypothetical protein
MGTLLAITEKFERLQPDLSRQLQKNCYSHFFNLLFDGWEWRQCTRQETVQYVGICSVSARSSL